MALKTEENSQKDVHAGQTTNQRGRAEHKIPKTNIITAPWTNRKLSTQTTDCCTKPKKERSHATR